MRVRFWKYDEYGESKFAIGWSEETLGNIGDFAQEDHSNVATLQERAKNENMMTILHCDVGPTTTAKRNRDNYFEAISSFQGAKHASVRPECILHGKRHPQRQPHATTARSKSGGHRLLPVGGTDGRSGTGGIFVPKLGSFAHER